MVLEAVTICLDNSEWMRNGDYTPTRMGAQVEAVNYVCTLKTQANAENAVGVLAMAGKKIDVLMTPGRDLGGVLSSLQSISIGGTSNFIAGIKTAQLCLKNRMNKNQRQRIIMFVGSPIKHTMKELVRLGKQLKKNNVSIDVINFGQENTENENNEILDAFINAANSSGSSHLINVPPGPHNLSDMILSTIMSDGSAPVPIGGVGMAAANAEFGGVDPNMDPDLAMAIRMSLEEERERQERSNEASGAATAAAAETGAEAAEDVSMAPADDEDAMLAQAIAMSMTANGESDVTMTEAPAAADDDAASAEVLMDANFLENVIEALPGVNQGDIDVQDILQSLDDDEKDKNTKPKPKK